MQDPPPPTVLLDLIAEFLRNVVVPQLSGHNAFQARVAANAVDLVNRDLRLRADAEHAELTRLRALLRADGSLEQLNAQLSERIGSGEMTLATPGLKEHLWATTLAKLAIDQPTYASYVREMTAPHDHTA